MDRTIHIKHIDTQPKGRTIAISDIHANLSGYRSLLKKIDYTPNLDRIVIVGDYIEKGTQNLETLHFIMDQCVNEDVHVVMGNCDFVCKNALYSYRLDFLKNILLMRRNSLLNEMASIIGIQVTKKTDMSWFCQQLRKHFLKELSFCNDTPHIIETKDTIYVHAALNGPDHYGDDFKEVINSSFFLKKNIYFPKRVVVGHMPVTEYCHTIADFNPIYDPSMNVYDIDGGNVVKKSGQLNALIFKDRMISMDSYDPLPEYEVLESVSERIQLPFFITWNGGKIDILQKKVHESYVYNKTIRRKFWVPNIFIKSGKANEYTNYQIPLNKGDTVKLVTTYGDKAQIKKNGKLGWTYLQALKKK